MNRSQAAPIVDQWLSFLHPVCDRIEPAGSFRRGSSEIKDIDIVCIPTLTQERDMFNDPTGRTINHLENWFDLRIDLLLTKNGSRYKQIALEGIKLELWIVLHPAQWGVIFTLRTGPADFGHWLVTQKKHGGALPSQYKFEEGAIRNGAGKVIPTPEEKDLFHLLDLPYLEPQDRIAKWSR